MNDLQIAVWLSFLDIVPAHYQSLDDIDIEGPLFQVEYVRKPLVMKTRFGAAVDFYGIFDLYLTISFLFL